MVNFYGTLPTNFSPAPLQVSGPGTVYYVLAAGLSSSNVQVSTTPGGSPVVAGSAGSGTLYGTVWSFDSTSGNNVTDTASGDIGTSYWAYGEANVTNVEAIPGTTYSASSSAMFVNPGSDWRPGSALLGAGVVYGNLSGTYVNCPGSLTCTWNFDSTDFIGTTRPNPPAVGPSQGSGSGPPTSLRVYLGLGPKW